MCEFPVVCWWYQFQVFWSHGCQGCDSEEEGERLQHPPDLTLEESLAHLARDFEINAGQWGKFLVHTCKAIVLQSLAIIYLSPSCLQQLYHCFWHFQRPRRRAVQEGSLQSSNLQHMKEQLGIHTPLHPATKWVHTRNKQ